MSAPIRPEAWSRHHGDLADDGTLNRFPTYQELVDCLARQRYTPISEEEIRTEMTLYAKLLVESVGGLTIVSNRSGLPV